MILSVLLLACNPAIESSGGHSYGGDGMYVEVPWPTVPLVQIVDVTAPEAKALELACVDTDGAGDEIAIADAGGTATRRLTIAGLLADTTYTCTVSSGDAAVDFDFTTPALPVAPPEMIIGGTGSAAGATAGTSPIPRSNQYIAQVIRHIIVLL